MAFKAINDTTDLDGLIFTFFVFGAYFHIVTDSPYSTSQD